MQARLGIQFLELIELKTHISPHYYFELGII